MTSTFQNKSHSKGFSIEMPNFRLFKPFSCTAMNYIPLENRPKLDTMAEHEICVGRSEGTLMVDGKENKGVRP